MPIQIIGRDAPSIADVDGETFRALRVTTRPCDYGSLGTYGIAQRTGPLSASLAANAELWQYRWTDTTRLNLVRRIWCSIGPRTNATTAALLSIELVMARNWTAQAAPGGGRSDATLTGDSGKFRTRMGTTLMTLIGQAGVNGLGAGTKTLDSHGIANVAFGILTGAPGTIIAYHLIGLPLLLEDESPDDHPVVLAQNEGLVIRNGPTAWPANADWLFGVTVRWDEVAAY